MHKPSEQHEYHHRPTSPAHTAQKSDVQSWLEQPCLPTRIRALDKSATQTASRTRASSANPGAALQPPLAASVWRHAQHQLEARINHQLSPKGPRIPNMPPPRDDRADPRLIAPDSSDVQVLPARGSWLAGSSIGQTLHRSSGVALSRDLHLAARPPLFFRFADRASKSYYLMPARHRNRKTG
jgi:hypothetical protein